MKSLIKFFITFREYSLGDIQEWFERSFDDFRSGVEILIKRGVAEMVYTNGVEAAEDPVGIDKKPGSGL